MGAERCTTNGTGGEGFGGLRLFDGFGFVVHFTLYVITNHVITVTNRVIGENYRR